LAATKGENDSASKTTHNTVSPSPQVNPTNDQEIACGHNRP
jgi:hypothetical protein